LALTLVFAGPARAQYQATGNDGITASPKARQSLDSYNNNHSSAVSPAKTAKMACAMCKNEVIFRTDYTARGANKPTVQISKHLCSMCEVELKTTGVGKAAKTLPVHACEGCTVASAN
jgi:hypothetical protein